MAGAICFPTHSLSLILFFFFLQKPDYFIHDSHGCGWFYTASMAQSVILFILALCVTITNVAFKNTHSFEKNRYLHMYKWVTLLYTCETDTLFNYNIKTNKQKTEQERMPWKWEILKKIKNMFPAFLPWFQCNWFEMGSGISIKKTSHLVRKPLSGNPVLCQIFAFLGFLISVVVGYVI